MKQLLLLVLMALALTSCRTQMLPKQLETTKTVKDSTYTTRQVVDTLQVIRPADTARISRLIKELSTTPTLYKSNQATVSIRKVGDQIEASCVCDELKEAVQVYKEITTRQQHIIEQQQETITLVQKEIPKLLKPFMYLGIGVAVLLVGTVVMKLIRP